MGHHLSALIRCEVIFKASWLDSFYSTNLTVFFLCRVGEWRFCGVATTHGCAIMRDCYCSLVFFILFGIFCSEQLHILNSSPLSRIATQRPYVFLLSFTKLFDRTFFTLQKKLPERLFRWSVRRRVLFTELRIFRRRRRRRRRVDETRRHLQADADEKGAGSQFWEFGMKSFVTSLDLESLAISKNVTEQIEDSLAMQWISTSPLIERNRR